ncbi:hypothetical protein TALC_00614 [Thermoplasmatales archaeon BRNA1]|nr:hypothetical protein TALC_00614 [Thermoplasmatales archaeon BRNA1]
MVSDNSPKATKRHEKLARSKKQEVENLEVKISMEQSALRHFKDDRAQQCKKLPREERAAFKADTRREVAKRKETIAKLKSEYRTKKAALKKKPEEPRKEAKSAPAKEAPKAEPVPEPKAEPAGEAPAEEVPAEETLSEESAAEEAPSEESSEETPSEEPPKGPSE